MNVTDTARATGEPRLISEHRYKVKSVVPISRSDYGGRYMDMVQVWFDVSGGGMVVMPGEAPAVGDTVVERRYVEAK